MTSLLRLFNWYVPQEFMDILNGVKNNTLKHININYELIHKFGDYSYREKNCPRFFQSLAEALIQNTSVTSITLSGYVFPDGAEYLVDALKRNFHVKNLSLNISTNASHKNLTALVSMLPHNSGLKKLSFYLGDIMAGEICVQIIESLRHNKTLEILEIDRICVLPRNGIEALSTLPQFNQTLQRLRLLKTTDLSELPATEIIREYYKEIVFTSREGVRKIAQTDSDNYLHCLPAGILNHILDYAKLDEVQKEEILSLR